MATHNPPPGVVLPRLAFTEGYLGPQAKFHEYGLSLVSHSDPMIYLEQDQPEVEIILGVPAGTRITIKMASLDYQKECNEYCLIRALGPNYLFLLRPPMPGFYKFQVKVLVSFFFFFFQFWKSSHAQRDTLCPSLFSIYLSTYQHIYQLEFASVSMYPFMYISTLFFFCWCYRQLEFVHTNSGYIDRCNCTFAVSKSQQVSTLRTIQNTPSLSWLLPFCP